MMVSKAQMAPVTGYSATKRSVIGPKIRDNYSGSVESQVQANQP